jgi:hypothetical protein
LVDRTEEMNSFFQFILENLEKFKGSKLRRAVGGVP